MSQSDLVFARDCCVARILPREVELVPVSRIEFTANRVCTGQSSDSEGALDQCQCAAVAPQVNLSFSFVYSLYCVSKHLFEFIAIERERELILIVGIVVSSHP